MTSKDEKLHSKLRGDGRVRTEDTYRQAEECSAACDRLTVERTITGTYKLTNNKQYEIEWMIFQ